MMKLSDMIKMCFTNLWRRRTRTLLTVVGVVIGSCAIVMMISLGLASNQNLDEMLKSFGELNVINVYGVKDISSSGNSGGTMVVMSSGGSDGNTGWNSYGREGMNDEAVEKFQSLEGVSAVLPFMEFDAEAINLFGGKNNRYLLRSWNTIATDLSQLEKFGIGIGEGALPEDPNDYRYLLVGEQVEYQFTDVKKKYGNNTVNQYKPDGTMNDPFVKLPEEELKLTVNNLKGQNMGINGGVWYLPSAGRRYEYKVPVKAILSAEKSSNNMSYYARSGVFYDTRFVKELMAETVSANHLKSEPKMNYNTIYIWVDDLNKVADIQKEVEELGFYADSMASMRESQLGQIRSQQMMLAGLAAISLFVAAIGITNTMIMSIYERTREIGVMKVLGCFVKNIRQMFLFEAGFIGLFGGMIGVGLSYVFSILLNNLGGDLIGIQTEMMSYMTESGEMATMPVSVIPLWLVLLALLFSMGIGLVSGYYPANRAVRISALEAIKTDG